MTNSGWTFSSVGATATTGAPKGRRTQNTYKKATETMTFATSDAAGDDLTGSVIDFIPQGVDWVLIANSDATNLCQGADVAVLAAATRGGTYGLLKDDLITAIDAIVAPAPYITNSGAGTAGYGDAPYYKLFLDADGIQKKTDTVVMNIYWTE